MILTDRRTEVTFRVADEHGQSTREFVGLLFASDKARWTEGSRYVRPLVPRPDPSPGTAPAGGSFGAATGGVVSGVVAVSGGATSTSTVVSSSQFVVPGATGGPPTRPDTITGLPPGDYFAVAVDDMEPDVLRDPELLDRLSRAATRVSLGEGATIDVSPHRIKLSDLLSDR